MALSWTMDKIGPMCRGVEDCALVFNSIYGSDGHDQTVVDAPFSWDAEFQVSRLRVGYIASELDLPPNGHLRISVDCGSHNEKSCRKR